jgi:hypothetical protein
LKLMAERDAAQATAERLRACLTEIATHDFYTMAGYPPAECLRDLARAALSSSSSAEAPRQHQEKDNA